MAAQDARHRTAPHAAPHGAVARLRAEIAAAVRLAALLGLVGAFGPFFLVYLQEHIFSMVLPTGSMATAWGLVTGFALAAVMVVALGHCRDLALVAIGNRIGRHLAAPALRAAASRRDAEPAQAAAQVLRDIEEVRRGVAGALCALALEAVLVPMLLLLLTVFHWAFALLALGFALLALVTGLVAERLTRGALAQSNAAAAQGAALVADAVRCAEAMQAMGMLPALVRRWADSLARGVRGLRAAQAAMRIASAVTITLYRLNTSSALVVGAVVTLAGADIGYGMVAGTLLAGRVMAPLGELGSVLEELAAARAAWGRLDALLRQDDAAAAPEGQAYPCPEGRLVVERLGYVHPGSVRPLLRDVSLRVGPGEVLAIAGPPGCGKSTLLRLILGLQPPSAGNVFLDGHATVHWDRADLARHVGYLPQDPALPGPTVAEAIARLAPRPDMAAVMRAAQLAGAERMIAGLPHGYATRLDGGLRLSMGQRQRLALARAVFGEPRLLLLDEPAAFLDEEGEAAVLRLIAGVAREGRAVILASHREALLAAAHRILPLQAGGPPALPAPPPIRRLAALAR